jgi:hypothetical protein
MAINRQYYRPQYLSRKAATEYLVAKYGFESRRMLAELAATGDGPRFHMHGRTALYSQHELDWWAQSPAGALHKPISPFPDLLDI